MLRRLLFLDLLPRHGYSLVLLQFFGSNCLHVCRLCGHWCIPGRTTGSINLTLTCHFCFVHGSRMLLVLYRIRRQGRWLDRKRLLWLLLLCDWGWSHACRHGAKVLSFRLTSFISICHGTEILALGLSSGRSNWDRWRNGWLFWGLLWRRWDGIDVLDAHGHSSKILSRTLRRSNLLRLLRLLLLRRGLLRRRLLWGCRRW